MELYGISATVDQDIWHSCITFAIKLQHYSLAKKCHLVQVCF